MASRNRLAIIGGGLGGYPAAIMAARTGAEVTLVEKELIGGTCVNWGCIPTKSYLHAGEIFESFKESEIFGLSCREFSLDFKAVAKRKNEVVEQLRQGVEKLLEAKKIRVVKGSAELTGSTSLRIRETDEKLEFDNLIIASGSKPGELDLPGLPGPGVLDSKQALEMESLPESLVIIGGGVIGVEFAQIFKRFGVKVTILELQDTLIPGSDLEIAAALKQSLVDEGIEVFNSANIEKIARPKGKIKVSFTSGNKSSSVSAEKLLLAVGRKPNLEGLGFERAGLASENGALAVDDRMRTNVPHIYAVGDVTGGMMLAHLAMAEAECAAENIWGGGDSRVAYNAVPACVYTSPEVASVGLSEEAAKETADVEIGRFPFYACGKAMILNRTQGMVKIVSEKKFGEVLGVHIIGPNATDMIAEAALGISMEMTKEELAHSIHPHPSLSEALMEAAKRLTTGAVHMP